VGHLSSSIKKCDLYYLFHKFGDIVEIMIKDDFAFIEYTNIHSAYRAMTELNGYRLGGCKLQIEEAKPRDGENFDEFYYRNRANMLATSKMYSSLTQGSRRARQPEAQEAQESQSPEIDDEEQVEEHRKRRLTSNKFACLAGLAL